MCAVDIAALMNATPNCIVVGENATDSQVQESSDHSETLSKRVSEQGGE